jgi:hypothetical protein
MDQSKLNPELSRWLEARQKSLHIVKTTTTPKGQILDWIPAESQVASGKIASPPPQISTPQRAANTDRPVKPISFELLDPAVERGPEGTVPILRPTISHLTRTIALKDYLSKRGGAKLQRQHTKAKPTDPDPAGYYHCTSQEVGLFYGCEGFLNVWDPVINVPEGDGSDHSILQFWVVNFEPLQQTIEGGWTVDHDLNGNLQPHLFTYYTTNSYVKDGSNLGGYNRQHHGWVQVSKTVFPGAQLGPVSVLNGDQYGFAMKFQLLQDPATGDFNWWILIDGIGMGYYPASLFSKLGTLGDNATFIQSGGEVAPGLKNPALTSDFMGSGFQAQGGWMQAAFLCNLRNQTDLNGTMVDSKGTTSSDVASPDSPHQYTIQSFFDSGTAMGSFVFLGGPMGGRSPFLYQIGGNKTSSTPFVTSDGWVYFRGTDNKLFKIKNDGTGQMQIGNNKTNSTPWVTSDGWVWFQGTDDKLFKVFNDGSQLSQPGNNKTSSSPTVVGDWVYFRGNDDKLFRMQTDGTGLNQINGNKTSSAPFVTSDGWVYFRGTDNKLFKVLADGSGQTQVGHNSTNSTPWVTTDGWVWFQGTDDRLWKVFNDGTGQSQPGNNKTSSSPTVVGNWVYFRGTDDKLFQMQTDGSQQTNLGDNKTASAPAATVDSVYFRGTNDGLFRFFLG